MTPLAPLLQAFFAERLARQRGASPHTIASYRDGFRLLLGFLHEQTGKQPSKLSLGDLELSTIAWVRCEGKGRKERCTPLTRQTVQVLRVWLRERDGNPTTPLFPTRSGRHLTRGAIWRRVLTHAATAAEQCSSLAAKNIT